MPESFFFHLRGPHFPMVLEECGNSMGKLLSQRGQSVCSNQKVYMLILKIQREFSRHIGIVPLYTDVLGYHLICIAFLP